MAASQRMSLRETVYADPVALSPLPGNDKPELGRKCARCDEGYQGLAAAKRRYRDAHHPWLLHFDRFARPAGGARLYVSVVPGKLGSSCCRRHFRIVAYPIAIMTRPSAGRAMNDRKRSQLTASRADASSTPSSQSP